MSKSGRKISGFFKAMLVAIVSFFIIYIFLPDTSERLFGVSIKSSPEVTQKVTQFVEESKDKVVEGVTNVVQDKLNTQQ